MKNNLPVALLILLIVTLGCSRITEIADKARSESGTANSNSEVAKAAEPPAAPGEYAPTSDPKADIEKLADRFMTLKSFRAEMEGDGETPMKTDVEFVSPDRYRIKTGSTMEMIVIGKTSYMKTGDKWQRMPLQLGSTISDMRTAFNKEGMKWFSDVKYTGDETLDGKSAYVYTYLGKGPNNIGENESKLWIGKSNGLPIKMDANYKKGSMKSMTIEYDYDTPVTIEAPVD